MATDVSTKTPEWVDAWRKWLLKNGPSLRSEIERGLSRVREPVTPHTVLWSEDMDGYDDATLPWDQLVRMEVRRPQGGRGGMPVIYFLWGQRHYAYAQYPNRTNRKADRK